MAEGGSSRNYSDNDWFVSRPNEPILRPPEKRPLPPLDHEFDGPEHEAFTPPPRRPREDVIRERDQALARSRANTLKADSARLNGTVSPYDLSRPGVARETPRFQVAEVTPEETRRRYDEAQGDYRPRPSERSADYWRTSNPEAQEKMRAAEARMEEQRRHLEELRAKLRESLNEDSLEELPTRNIEPLAPELDDYDDVTHRRTETIWRPSANQRREIDRITESPRLPQARYYKVDDLEDHPDPQGAIDDWYKKPASQTWSESSSRPTASQRISPLEGRRSEQTWVENDEDSTRHERTQAKPRPIERPAEYSSRRREPSPFDSEFAYEAAPQPQSLRRPDLQNQREAETSPQLELNQTLRELIELASSQGMIYDRLNADSLLHADRTIPKKTGGLFKRLFSRRPLSPHEQGWAKVDSIVDALLERADDQANMKLETAAEKLQNRILTLREQLET